jgi:hypothetical protein
MSTPSLPSKKLFYCLQATCNYSGLDRKFEYLQIHTPVINKPLTTTIALPTCIFKSESAQQIQLKF